MESPIMNLLLKFNEENIELIDGTMSTTSKEHLKIIEEKNKLIWGQGSEKKVNGMGKDKRKKIEEQIGGLLPTYVFFTAINKGTRILYVGNYLNSYDKGVLTEGSGEIEYIPPYYRDVVGTNEDRNVLFVEVGKLVELDNKLIDSILLYKDSQKILDVKNSSSIFYVKVTEEFYKYLNQIFKSETDEKKNKSILEEIDYQNEVEKINVPDNVQVEDVVKPIPKKGTKTSNSYERDPKTSKNAITLAKYCCEFNDEHKFFISKVTKCNYVEAHHLIPMEYQKLYDKASLDVEANITSLCNVCHKILHHAVFDEKKYILEKLFNERRERLKSCGIKIDLKKLYSYYK